jgi:hypothetical protein
LLYCRPYEPLRPKYPFVSNDSVVQVTLAAKGKLYVVYIYREFLCYGLLKRPANIACYLTPITIKNGRTLVSGTSIRMQFM